MMPPVVMVPAVVAMVVMFPVPMRNHNNAVAAMMMAVMTVMPAITVIPVITVLDSRHIAHGGPNGVRVAHRGRLRCQRRRHESENRQHC